MHYMVSQPLSYAHYIKIKPCALLDMSIIRQTSPTLPLPLPLPLSFPLPLPLFLSHRLKNTYNFSYSKHPVFVNSLIARPPYPSPSIAPSSPPLPASPSPSSPLSLRLPLRPLTSRAVSMSPVVPVGRAVSPPSLQQTEWRPPPPPPPPPAPASAAGQQEGRSPGVPVWAAAPARPSRHQPAPASAGPSGIHLALSERPLPCWRDWEGLH